MQEGTGLESRPFIVNVFRTGVWHLFPIIAFYVAAYGLIYPFIPDMMTNFFASRIAGETVHCNDFPPDHSPRACGDAHSVVAAWSAWTSFMTNTAFGFLLSPVIGVASDIHGRKVFMLLAQFLSFLPKLVLLLHVDVGFSLYWYYPMDAFNGAISLTTVAISYVADCLPPSQRAAGFGMVLSALFCGITFTPRLGALLTPRLAVHIAVGCKVFGLLYTLVLVRESLSKDARRAAAAAPKTQQNSIMAVLRSFGILFRYPFFVKLTICMMISGISSNGSYALLTQYLQMRLGFNAADQANVFLAFGIPSLIIQGVFLQAIVGTLGDKWTLVLSFALSALRNVGLAFAHEKWQAFVAFVLGAATVVSFPAISSIKSNNVGDHEQGQVQGALNGAVALAQGVGPVMFSQIFWWTSRHNSPIHFPAAFLLYAAALMVLAMIVAATIHMTSVQRKDGAHTGAIDVEADASAQAVQHDDALTTPLLLPSDPETDTALYLQPVLTSPAVSPRVVHASPTHFQQAE